ncbi:MAG TPA: chemotaxis protein CheW [Burkholderiaceae bacterium]|nr:chemotaxis protein CheW [Burkholderiaceae bacterium]
MERNRQTVKLREFSTQLAERLRAAPTMPSAPLRLAVRIGPESYLLDMAAAGEIVNTPSVAPVPWTRRWYRGLANVRGRLVGVIDIMDMAGREPLAADQAQQLLVFGAALNVNAGILISRAFGLRNTKELEPLDVAAPAAAPWEVARYRDLDGTLLTELELPRLVAADVFSAIGT